MTSTGACKMGRPHTAGGFGVAGTCIDPVRQRPLPTQSNTLKSLMFAFELRIVRTLPPEECLVPGRDRALLHLVLRPPHPQQLERTGRALM